MALESINGTLIACVGPPGCGKSYAATWLALKLAKHNGIPFVGIDPAGELTKYVEGFAEYARECGESDTEQWLRDPSTVRILTLGDGPGEFSIDAALDAIERLVLHSCDGGTTEPTCVVFLDELALIREQREKFQNVTIPRFRNTGITGFGTCQTMAGITPKARACLRVVLAWKTTKGGADIFDQWFDNSLLTAPQSDLISLVTPWDGRVSRFDLNDPPPAVLSVPVRPTQLVKRRL
jgi:hypothetical protein